MSTEKTVSRKREQSSELEELRAIVAALKAETDELKAEKAAREKAEAAAAAAAEAERIEDERRVKVFVKIRREQPSQIWDAKKGRLLAEFNRQGVCQTKDPKAVKELRKMGYPEVPPGSRPMPTPLAEPDPFAAGFIEVVNG